MKFIITIEEKSGPEGKSLAMGFNSDPPMEEGVAPPTGLATAMCAYLMQQFKSGLWLVAAVNQKQEEAPEIQPINRLNHKG